MQEKVDFVVFNTINAGALSVSLLDIESMLTILVLITALIYNVKKIRNDK
tara:strand:+ start:9517 stop:9666 length:150 start_codon:yes stop_codon:yes gene_type:complete